MVLQKICSGGQTGVDRAALDVGLVLGIAIGGWCPKGGRSEDGVIDKVYGLQETESSDYQPRTRKNIEDSDGTLILWRPPMGRGTQLTMKLCKQLKKPHLVLNLEENPDPKAIRHWIEEFNISTINVAGGRESKHPGIYRQATRLLIETLIIFRRNKLQQGR